MSTMRAAVYHGSGDVRVTEVPVPAPGPGEVLVKVAAAGVCGTDAAEYEHPRLISGGEPVVLGHEFAGQVVAAGPGAPRALLGQLIACGAGVSCGDCAMCGRGRTNLCRSYHTLGFHRNGGLAEFVSVPAAICVPAGERGLSADTAALAQPMAIAVHARSRGQVRAGQTVLIVGAGGIGAFLTFACASAGARVWVADVADDRLALAAALGAARVVNAGTDDPAAALDAAGVAAETIFEVSGSPGGLDTAQRAARPGARIVLVGVQEAPGQARLADWTLREYDVVGTVAHVCARDLPAALDLLAEGEGAWQAVAPAVLPLDRLVRDGLGAGRSAQVKTLFDPAAAAPRQARHEGGGGGATTSRSG